MGNRGFYGFSFNPISSVLEGGDVSYFENYKIHTFLKSGLLVVNTPVLVEALIAGGGGSSGGGKSGVSWSGSGGGGGLLIGMIDLPAGTYRLIIGAGGAAVSTQTRGLNGQNSILGDYIALGGGAGGASSVNSSPAKDGATGGSGGGGGGQYTGAAGSGVQSTIVDMIGYANNGAAGTATANAGASGGAGSAAVTTTKGNGLSSSISGSAVTYCEGNTNGSTPGGTNTGTGGGGTTGAGTAGGSGIIIIRYVII